MTHHFLLSGATALAGSAHGASPARLRRPPGVVAAARDLGKPQSLCLAADPRAAASHVVLEKLDIMDRTLAAQAAAIAAQRADLACARALVQRCQGCAEPLVRAVCDRCLVSAGVDGSRVLQVVWEEPARD